MTTLKTVTYNFSDISAITYSEKYHTKKGVEKSIAHYRIVMNDGYMYSSHVHAFFSLQEDHDRLKKKMEELSARTGLTIRTIP